MSRLTSSSGLRLEVLDEAEALARHAADLVCAELRAAVEARGAATLALSGGRSPVRMFELAAREQLPWARIDVLQVDERVAPALHPDRNALAIRRAFASVLDSYPDNFHWMPVEAADLEAAAEAYARTLRLRAGSPAVLDCVQLGLGADGHTASIFPGAPLPHEELDVVVTTPRQGRRRMTLTLAAINRARCILWIVTGAEKAGALAGLVQGDPALPASHVRGSDAVLLADAPAAAMLGRPFVAGSSGA